MKYVIANFKSNKNAKEILDWISEYSALNLHRTAAVVLCPPLPHLSLFSELSMQQDVSLGVQDISPFPAGAYTGAVGAHNLSGSGVQYAIVGHSERRRYFHETTQDIANKVHECISAAITPILCVTRDEISKQAGALAEDEKKKILVAFEPIDHIGTGTSDTYEDILETKKLVTNAFGPVPYIYGGSVNPETDLRILQSTDIDGFLVGTASLDPKKFVELLGRCTA